MQARDLARPAGGIMNRRRFPERATVGHARGLTFDEKGHETGFDFPRCFRIAKAAGFKGVCSSEFAGPGDSYEGTQRIIEQRVELLWVDRPSPEYPRVGKGEDCATPLPDCQTGGCRIEPSCRSRLV